MVRFGRGFAIALLSIGLFPGIARAGFFDFLFPQFQAPTARPFEPRPGYRIFGAGPGLYRHNFRKHKLAARGKVIVADKTHHRAHRMILADETNHLVRPYTPINLMDDESLRHGDAVMTGAGSGFSSAITVVNTIRRISGCFPKSREFPNASEMLSLPSTHLGQIPAPTKASLEWSRGVL
jgi:hypothetical protein